MPLKTLRGPNLTALLRQAQLAIGADAVVLHTRRVATAEGPMFEILAADATTADWQARTRPEPRRAAAAEAMAPRPAGDGPLIIALVGPTGGGKTTTLAKLATHPRVFGTERVAVVGLDTYRVGAIEQLRTYAEIARLPLEVAYHEEDIAGIRSRLAGHAVWLVDTAGRSPRRRDDRRLTEAMLAALQPTEVHLVLPATTAPHLAPRLVADARILGVTHLLATKLDEAGGEDALFALAVELGLPMRWVTAGQEVPFDLGSASEPLGRARVREAMAPTWRLEDSR